LALSCHDGGTRTSGTAVYLGKNIGEIKLENLNIRNGGDYGLVLDNCSTGDFRNITIGQDINNACITGVLISQTIDNYFSHVIVAAETNGWVIDSQVDTLTLDHCTCCKTTGAYGTSPTYSFLTQNTTGGTHLPRWIKFNKCFAEAGDSGIGYNLTNCYGVDLTDCYSAWGKYGVQILSTAHDIRIKGGEYFYANQYCF